MFRRQACPPTQAERPTTLSLRSQALSPTQPCFSTSPVFLRQADSPMQAPAYTEPVLPSQASGPIQLGVPAHAIEPGRSRRVTTRLSSATALAQNRFDILTSLWRAAMGTSGLVMVVR